MRRAMVNTAAALTLIGFGIAFYTAAALERRAADEAIAAVRVTWNPNLSREAVARLRESIARRYDLGIAGTRDIAAALIAVPGVSEEQLQVLAAVLPAIAARHHRSTELPAIARVAGKALTWPKWHALDFMVMIGATPEQLARLRAALAATDFWDNRPARAAVWERIQELAG